MSGQRQRPGKKGGAATGPDPTNRGKPGTKRHLVADRRGTPLAALLTGADRHDSAVFEELIDAVPPIKRPRGRPRQRPEKVHADKAYDVTSRSGSLARASTPAPALAATGGWSSAPWLGSTNSVG